MSQAVQPITTQDNVSDLLDILYEILASGLEPEGSSVTMQEIETVLHQHARSPKSRSEMEAFFRRAALPTQIESVARVSGLQLASVSPSTVSSNPGDLPAPDSTTGRHRMPRALSLVDGTVERTQPAATTVPASVGVVPTRVWWAVAALLTVMLTACVLGGHALLGLRDQLVRSEVSQRLLVGELQQLRSRTEHLDKRLDQQAATLQTTGVSVERLVQTFLPAEPAE